jgi:predicted negative regulator of RcsB-dependent stress response
MAYDLEEQEQLAQLKAWWQKYGNLITTVLTVVLLAFAAYNGWRWYEREQAKTAAGIYGQLEQAVQARDAAKVQTLASSIIEHYGRTTYAVMGAMQAARLNAEVGDLSKAAEQLQWVIDKSGHDELTMIARVRLAGVLLDEKKYDEALKTLAFDAPATYQTVVLDRRGDVLAAQNKPVEARAAYTEALAKADAQHPLRAIIQLKLDALPPAAAS